MNKCIYYGNVYNEIELNNIVEIFTDEKSDNIESVYMIVKEYTHIKDNYYKVYGYNVSELILY